MRRNSILTTALILLGATTAIAYASIPSNHTNGLEGSLDCTKCSCSGWYGGSSYNSPCPRTGCGHTYVQHRRAGD
jgi:hypothetical protein